jgi:HSP20 family protein
VIQKNTKRPNIGSIHKWRKQMNNRLPVYKTYNVHPADLVNTNIMNTRSALLDLFETPFNNFFDDFFGTKKSFNLNTASYPKMDITEDADHFYIKCAVPGIKEEDLSIESDKTARTVTVKGKSIKSTVTPDESGSSIVYVKELKTSSFARSVKLPDYVDLDSVEADLLDGILTLTFDLFKVIEEEDKNVKKIEIKRR